MVLEQHIYQTNADYAECQRRASGSPDVRSCIPSQKGVLTIRFKNHKAIAQISSKGTLMLYVDSSEYDEAWNVLKPVLATIDGRPLEIKTLDRIPHPDNIRLRALIQQAQEDGSIESQLSVIKEIERASKKKRDLRSRPNSAAMKPSLPKP